MSSLYNRARVNTATAGTGTMTLGSATSAAFFTFAEAGVPDGTVVSYVIEDGSNVELGIGTYTSAGTTLSRTTVTISKISGVAGTTKITLSGSAIVYIDALAADIVPYTSGTASTSSTTGALNVTGGAGVSGDINAGGYVSAATPSGFKLGADTLAYSYISGVTGAQFFSVRDADNNARIELGDALDTASYYTGDSHQFWSLGYGQEFLQYDADGFKIFTNIPSTSTTTGSVQVTGGMGLTGDIYLGGIVVGTCLQNLVQSASMVMPGSTGLHAPDYYELSAGISLEVGALSVFEIG